VHQTVRIDPFKPPAAFQPLGGVAVIADNTGRHSGAQELKITGTTAERILRFGRIQEGAPGNRAQAGEANSQRGRHDQAFPTTNVVEADYYVPLLSHAPMEPMVALADQGRQSHGVGADADPQAAQAIVASELGIAKEDVICHVTLLGEDSEENRNRIMLRSRGVVQELGRPVKVVWSREDDIKFDYYNAVAAMYMKAAVDAKGKPTAWLQRSVFPPITSISM